MTSTSTIIRDALAAAIADPVDRLGPILKATRWDLDSADVNLLLDELAQAAANAVALDADTPAGLEQIGTISEDPARGDLEGEWRFHYEGDTDHEGHRNIEPVYRIVDVAKLRSGTVVEGG